MMPIIHFANSKNQTTGGLKKLLGYVSREKKTKLEDRRFVTGINCSPESTYEEMLLTKQMHKKTGGRLYYHLVQSFPKGYEIKPELAHKIALELTGKALKDYECLVATHIDREHIHSHIVFNSVSFEDGRKYHSDNNSLHELMKLSDEICRQYGVAVLDKPKFGKENQNDVLGDKEYRSAVRGESFKFALMNVITDCMKQAKTKKQFIALMKRKGYDVRWEQQRKYITYTTPKGKKCRCNKLHDRRFTKEVMEYEFKIRYAIFNGTEQDEPERSSRDTAYGGRSGAELDGGAEDIEFDLSVAGRGQRRVKRAADRQTDDEVRAEPVDTAGQVPAGERTESSADTSGDERDEQRTAQTGWEHERRILISAERARELAAESKLKAVQGADSITSAAIDTVGDIAALATLIEDSDEDEDKHYSAVDRKRLKEEWEKKESLGMHMG
ncbi:relaxase/mobilization nuclease domain-containing protein [Ruminococcus sp. FC2018]|uniref:relaxase/mobilization nuclease domain-containing protein n=1 Tax=Ruminococcus sp. FC2018 TaxID=1410617 RepID=UPI000A908005|nr:relaxase/mobilization nuclease domain-containing protein [Ruminococcus sp. FC2018]